MQYQVNDDTQSNYGWLALRFSYIRFHVHESIYFASYHDKALVTSCLVL